MNRSLVWMVIGGALLAAATWADAQMAFVKGRIETSAAPQRGFEAAPYLSARSGEKDWSFNAEQKSASQSWRASIL